MAFPTSISLLSYIILFSQEDTFHSAFTFQQELIWIALIVSILLSHIAKSGIDYIGDIFQSIKGFSIPEV